MTMQTNNATQVVRCEDCKYWCRALVKLADGKQPDFGFCKHWGDGLKDDDDTADTDADEYCSRGKLRDSCDRRYFVIKTDGGREHSGGVTT